MRRYFNTEGLCDPQEHYMVRLDERLDKIKRLFVDRSKYFVINRGRQYGKTTTLRALAEYLKEDYIVLSMDFQQIGTDEFKAGAVFSYAFANVLIDALNNAGAEEKTELADLFRDFAGRNKNGTLRELFVQLSELCRRASKPVVMMIDEVDSASNNQVFLDFLALLRGYYLERKIRPTFQSVILAGVYDIKSLKLKMRSEDEHKYNSPWNIAANFDIDMNFSENQIQTMLLEYEADNHTGMNVETISKCIYEYTSGYPYLVSAICKWIDEKIYGTKEFQCLADAWTEEGIRLAVRNILDEQLPLFGSMMRQLSEYPELKQMLNALLFQGKRVTFNPDNPAISLAAMFGYIVNRQGSVQVANRIFEMRLYNYFLSEEELKSAIYDEAQGSRSQFISEGRLDMRRVLEKFVIHFSDIYGDNDEKFIEEYGRKFFLLYLKPIINGTGNYYIEARTRDARRTDVIVDYLGEQFVVELKIWRGNEYHERGEKQLTEYLDYYHLERGYLLSFNFNKKKEIGVKEIHVGDKVIVEAVV